ncbi:hypothetical protein B0T10DRAFT_252307 [Thelonectria olida]|uniref:Secreted protein n=1 Tax=Thelonectria olida TaxID=1576542 RepID=A0A9P9AQ56_9HYPO|nr:hypothetical protein B0T10DRAFT_252307 [Thelonectria olida]
MTLFQMLPFSLSLSLSLSVFFSHGRKLNEQELSSCATDTKNNPGSLSLVLFPARRRHSGVRGGSGKKGPRGTVHKEDRATGGRNSESTRSERADEWMDEEDAKRSICKGCEIVMAAIGEEELSCLLACSSFSSCPQSNPQGKRVMHSEHVLMFFMSFEDVCPSFDAPSQLKFLSLSLLSRPAC